MNLLKFIPIIGLALITSCGLDSSNRNRLYRCEYEYLIEHCITRDIDTVSFVDNCYCKIYIRVHNTPVPIFGTVTDDEYYRTNDLYYNYCNYWFVSKDTL